MRCGLFALLLGLAGPLVQATEDPSTSARKPTTIESAQTEFKSLQPQQHVPEAGAKLSIPGLTTLQTTEDLPVPSPLQRFKALQEKKESARSKNWLVDAMREAPEKSSAEGNRTGADTTKEDESLDPFERLIAANKRETISKARAASMAEEERQELQSKVVNPLSGYMAGWISARDQDLLLRDVTAPDAALSISRFSDSIPAAGPILNHGVFSPAAEAAVTGRPDHFSPPANPYLALPVINPNERALFPVVGEAALQPRNLPPPVQVAAPPPQSPPAKDIMPPGLAKPEEDARYFPQLKRF